MKQERSLKSRALQLLAQRDQSRLELRRKLLQHARRGAAGPVGVAGRQDGPANDDATNVDFDQTAVVAEVDTLLDWLEANRFLSNERFAESRIQARQARFGVQRIRQELAQHSVELPAALAETLAASELERAAAVRARRFADAPVDAAQRAAQSRFLLARGFSGDIVRQLMRGLGRRAGPDPAAPLSDG